jgi:hypothetical protein
MPTGNASGDGSGWSENVAMTPPNFSAMLGLGTGLPRYFAPRNDDSGGMALQGVLD